MCATVGSAHFNLEGGGGRSLNSKKPITREHVLMMVASPKFKCTLVRERILVRVREWSDVHFIAAARPIPEQ